MISKDFSLNTRFYTFILTWLTKIMVPDMKTHRNMRRDYFDLIKGNFMEPPSFLLETTLRIKEEIKKYIALF